MVADVALGNRPDIPGPLVILPILMDQGGTRQDGLQRIEDRRQFLVIDLDQVHGCPGDVLVIGHHGGNGFPDIAHLLVRDERFVLDDGAVHEGAIGAGHDGSDPRQGGGPRGVHLQDPGVGERGCGKQRRKVAGQT